MAPAIAEQLAPAVLHRCHCRATVNGAPPAHATGEATTYFPCWNVPTMVGESSAIGFAFAGPISGAAKNEPPTRDVSRTSPVPFASMRYSCVQDAPVASRSDTNTMSPSGVHTGSVSSSG